MRLTSTDALVVWLSGVIEAMDPCNNDRAQGLVDGFKTVLEVIESAEPIEAEVVKHGRWLYVCGKGRHAEYECSECKIHVHFDEKIDGSIPPYKRCPECGAIMDLEE